jgi:dual specificity protein kinase YAK1
MLDMGKQTNQFFDSYADLYGQKKYRLKSLEQYSREHNTNEQPGKQYFKATSLPDIINTAPMPTFKSSSRQGHEMEKGLLCLIFLLPAELMGCFDCRTKQSGVVY